MPKLSDTEVHDALHRALLALGRSDGETIRGDTALKAARRSLSIYQMSLLVDLDDDGKLIPRDQAET